MKQSTKFELLLLLTALLWGAGFPITKTAVENGFGPFTIMTGRFSVASVALTPIFWRQLKKMSLSHVKAGVFAGTLLFLGFVFQTYGIVYTTPSKNAFITQMMVIVVPFISWCVYKSRPTKQAILGAFVALVGGFILTFSSTMFTSGINLGDFLTLLCAVMVAAHIVVSTHYASKHHINPIGFSIVQFYVAAILSLVLMFSFEDVSRETSVMDYMPLIYLGLVNTAWGFTIQTFAHKHSSTTRTSIIVSTEALFAMLISLAFFDEVFTLQLLVGGTIILGSVLYVEWSHQDEEVLAK